MTDTTLSIQEAKKVLEMSKESLELGLRQKLFPFGVAVKHQLQWSYHIWKRPLMKYLDITEEELNEKINN